MRSPAPTSNGLETAILPIILTVASIAASVFILLLQNRFSSRRLEYGLLSAGPIIRTPAKGSKDLTVVYDGAALDDPRFAELRLINPSRKDIPSSTFDQEMPLCFDLGATILKVLQTTVTPSGPPFPRTKIDGSTVEIGPGLIRKRSQINLVLVADGPITSLSHGHNPLVNNPLVEVKVTELRREGSESLYDIGLTPAAVIGLLASAFVIWWIIVEPASVARVVHNIGIFLSGAAHGIATFFTSL
jgi:hypothetical protein